MDGLNALRGISSGHALARPYLEQGLKDPDPQAQRMAADAVRWFGPAHGSWAIDDLLQLADNSVVFESALHALNCLETNSVRILPKLREKLAMESDPARQKIIAHSIHYISQFGPPDQRQE